MLWPSPASPRQTTVPSAQPAALTATYATTSQVRTSSSCPRAASTARPTSSQPATGAAAATVETTARNAIARPRPAVYRRRRDSPTRGLRGNDLVPEERGEQATVREQLGRRPVLDDATLVEDDGPVGDLDRREPLRRDEDGHAG